MLWVESGSTAPNQVWINYWFLKYMYVNYQILIELYRYMLCTMSFLPILLLWYLTHLINDTTVEWQHTFNIIMRLEYIGMTSLLDYRYFLSTTCETWVDRYKPNLIHNISWLRDTATTSTHHSISMCLLCQTDIIQYCESDKLLVNRYLDHRILFPFDRIAFSSSLNCFSTGMPVFICLECLYKVWTFSSYVQYYAGWPTDWSKAKTLTDFMLIHLRIWQGIHKYCWKYNYSVIAHIVDWKNQWLHSNQVLWYGIL